MPACCWSNCPRADEIVALCDCNLPRAEAFKAAKKGNWKTYQHYQEMLDRKDIDAVIVATGEFQRVLPCVHACQAGKDIYAEKPLTLYIHEGRVLVDAVRKHGRVCQVGLQQRSMAMNRIACQLVRSGELGKVKEVLEPNFPSSEPSPAQPFPAEAAPAGLDWDVWLNQAAARPYNGQWMSWGPARLRRRRGHQLGRPRRRPGPMGPGHGRHRAGRDVAGRRH